MRERGGPGEGGLLRPSFVLPRPPPRGRGKPRAYLSQASRTHPLPRAPGSTPGSRQPADPQASEPAQAQTLTDPSSRGVAGRACAVRARSREEGARHAPPLKLRGSGDADLLVEYVRRRAGSGLLATPVVRHWVFLSRNIVSLAPYGGLAVSQTAKAFPSLRPAGGPVGIDGCDWQAGAMKI